MLNKNHKISIYNITLLAIPMLLYLFFGIFDGAVWCADTASYVEMHSSREPLYPMYLAMLRTLFDANIVYRDLPLYLFVAALGQSVLAGIAAWSISRYLTKVLSLPRFMGYIIIIMPIATSLLCRFAAKRSSMYSNSILTEGIVISLFLIFIRFCTEYVFENTRKSYIWCIILCIIGISTRKQMYIMLFLFLISCIYPDCKKINR